MNDKISDIIYKALYNETSPRPMLAESTAKQIRQQIGRELLGYGYNNKSGKHVVDLRSIREICQLGEDNES